MRRAAVRTTECLASAEAVCTELRLWTIAMELRSRALSYYMNSARTGGSL